MRTHYSIDRSGSGALLLLPLLSLEILPAKYADHRLRISFHWFRFGCELVLIQTTLITKLRVITAHQIKLFLAHVLIFLPATLTLTLKVYLALFRG